MSCPLTNFYQQEAKPYAIIHTSLASSFLPIFYILKNNFQQYSFIMLFPVQKLFTFPYFSFHQGKIFHNISAQAPFLLLCHSAWSHHSSQIPHNIVNMYNLYSCQDTANSSPLSGAFIILQEPTDRGK